jgi:glycosyltransferase involved in cell wall biosynthesis
MDRIPTQAVDLSVLVPVLNERESLAQLCSEVEEAIGRVRPEHWELILIDDGSTDGSWVEIQRLSKLSHHIRGLRLRRNLGKSAALAAGVRLSSGHIIATLDGDLQDDPAELPGMIARLDEPSDLVAGYKAERRDPITKRLASRVFNFFTSLVTGLKLRDHNCGLKVGRREVFTNVPLYGEMHRFFAAMSHAQGFAVVEQPVRHRPRLHGSSKFGLERYARGGLDLLTVVALTRFSRRPAHLLGGVGLVLGVVGVGILMYLTGLWFFTDQAIGSRPLLLLGMLFVLVAVQLAGVGILAEVIVSKDATEEDPLRHVTERVNA